MPPRSLRSLTVIALCSAVAGLAVLVTEATQPYASGGTWIAGTDPGYVYDPSATDAPRDADASAPAGSAPAGSPGIVADATNNVAPAQTTDEPAPPAVTGPRTPPPSPANMPVPGSSTTAPSRPSPALSTSPPGQAYYEAESAVNTLTGTRIYSCAPCSGGKKVGYIGLIGATTGVVIFNRVSWGNGGSVVLVIFYVNGDTRNRTAQFSVNAAAPITISFSPTGGWNTVKTVIVRLTLQPGYNQVKFTNPTTAGPDLDMIAVRSP